MTHTRENTGYFVFSLDTELGWGHYDLDRLRRKRFSQDGSRERESIRGLIDLLDEFGIVGTWAVVGHLFYEKCEECSICPILEWKGRYRSFQEIYKSNHPLWYGADIMELLVSRSPPDEIAFHGYTHRIFDTEIMRHIDARTEISEWLRLGKRMGISLVSVAFPRNRIGHLGVFKELGFICYRETDRIPHLLKLKYVGPFIKSLDYLVAASTPKVYEVNEVDSHGLVALRGSDYFFDFNRKLESIIDSLGLHRARIRRMIKGVKKAAEKERIFHLWCHPCEFRTAKDFDKLRYLFGHVRSEIDRGMIRSVCMGELARKIVHISESD